MTDELEREVERRREADQQRLAERAREADEERDKEREAEQGHLDLVEAERQLQEEAERQYRARMNRGHGGF